MTVLLAWGAFPLVLTALSLGLGLLVEALVRIPVRGVLVLPLGFAALVVLTTLSTMPAATAPLTIPLVVILAGVGLFFGIRRGIGLDAWPAVSAAGAFAVFAAPVVLSGTATFTGWIKLDDGATWLAFADRILEHGRNVTGLPHSSYEVTLALNLGNGYPVGGFVPLGVGGKLVGQDLAWLIQPYMAFCAALLALGIYTLVSRVVEGGPLRALVAFISAQAALYYGYALWGGVKEVVAAPLIALAAALAAWLLGAEDPRAAAALGVASAAVVAVQSVGGAIWLLPILVPIAFVLVRERASSFVVRAGSMFLGVALLLSIPTVATAAAFASELRASSVATGADVLGNLLRPLKPVQAMGIWPAGDFRVDPHDLGPTYVLIAVAAAAACFGVGHALHARAPELPLFVASALVNAVVLTQLASPWIAGKALATASPALVAAALVGASRLLGAGRRPEGAVLFLAIAGGVLWSNTLQYHDATLAPRAQLSELQTIGHRFAGDGPALMTEYNPYGVRHFLRALDAEGATELRWRPIPLRHGELAEKGTDVDVDDLNTKSLLVYRTLVLRRAATASRPPSVYSLAWKGHFYEVWQRPRGAATRVIDHLSLGNRLQPSATPSCGDVIRLAGAAGPTGRLAAFERENPRLYDPSAWSAPVGWSADPSLPGSVHPAGNGELAVEVRTGPRDRYSFFLGGSFRDRLEFFVDARRIYSGRHQLNWPGKYTPLGDVALRPGRHLLLIRYSGPDLRPGSGGEQFSFGPLAFGRSTATSRVTYVSTTDARALCGKRLDWIEALASKPQSE